MNEAHLEVVKHQIKVVCVCIYCTHCQVSIPIDLAGQATVHKDRWVWAGNKGWVAKLQVVSGVIDGNCDHPSNSGKDGEVGELIRPHSTNQSLVE